jgi:hypothetical protein
METVNENLLAPDQRTASWYADRAGKFTGSRFVDVLSRNKKTGEKTEAYHRLINQIVVERITGTYLDSGMDSYALKWGRDVEPYARSAYQFEYGEKVETIGFVNHPTISFAGVSPDGLVNRRHAHSSYAVLSSGGTEFKCPKDPLIHLERFRSGMEEDEYMPQVQGCIWVLQADWWDWVSYDPRMPPHLRLYRQRVYRDDAYIKTLEEAILRAEADVRNRMKQFEPELIEQILEERSKPKPQGVTS